MIGINNLVDMLLACIEHPNAAEKTFLVSDGKDLSTRELIKLIASSMDSSSKLFPVPISLLRFVSKIIGKEDEINRLLGSFQVDTSYTREILNWKPTISVEEEIREMVQFL